METKGGNKEPTMGTRPGRMKRSMLSLTAFTSLSSFDSFIHVGFFPFTTFHYLTLQLYSEGKSASHTLALQANDLSAGVGLFAEMASRGSWAIEGSLSLSLSAVRGIRAFFGFCGLSVGSL